MASTKFKGSEVHTNGNLPEVGTQVPLLTLVGTDLKEKSLEEFAGKKKVLTINPSYDTGTCQMAARAFNKKIGDRSDAVVLTVSADLPFAHKRFCESEGLSHVVPLSSFRSTFAKDWGVELVDGPLKGLTARAVVVLDESNKVVYRQLVPEITEEPDYDAAMSALG